MSIVDSAAARILPPLSALLQKPLSIVDPHSSEAALAFSVRVNVPRMSVVSGDGLPFSDTERKFLHEVFELVRLAEESDARFSELEQRMQGLQRENLDLIVKNRVLSEVSTRDALTGLYNRWYVIEKIDTEINRSLRHGSPMALLMLDIDHFKRINDSYGHGVGDQVLVAVGRVLRESCRGYDTAGRYGGEEFCVLLPETRMLNTTIVAERIRRKLETSFVPVGDTAITVTASIGVAGVETAEEAALSPGALIERADRALYSAKHRGRNRVELWDEEGPASPSEMVSH